MFGYTNYLQNSRTNLNTSHLTKSFMRITVKSTNMYYPKPKVPKRYFVNKLTVLLLLAIELLEGKSFSEATRNSAHKIPIVIFVGALFCEPTAF